MFNFVVLPNSYKWQSEFADIKAERFLEYTDGEIKQKFEDLSEVTFSQLCALPAVFASEAGTAYVGKITKIENRQDTLRFHYEIDPTVVPFSLRDFVSHEFEFGTKRYEATRTHWAVKKYDLYTGIESANLGRNTDHKPTVSLFRTAFRVKMAKVLRDPIWQFVGAVATVLTVLLFFLS